MILALLPLLACSVRADVTNIYSGKDHGDRYTYERIESTNLVYVTAGDFLLLETNEWIETNLPAKALRPEFYRFVIEPHKVEEVRTNRECLPATAFPEGNWGDPLLGHQLSLRFTKPTYANGEPVNAILLVRNLTTNFLGFHHILHPMGGPVHFHVTTESGQILPEKEYRLGGVWGSNYFSNPILPITQHRYVENLKEGYTLPPGVYTVQAFITIPLEEDKLVDGKWVRSPTKEVTSAKITIRIER